MIAERNVVHELCLMQHHLKCASKEEEINWKEVHVESYTWLHTLLKNA